MTALAALVRTRFTDQEADDACSLLRGPLDWHVFLDLAWNHAVIPLVWSGLQQTGGRELVPAETRDRLAELNRDTAWNNMLLAGEMQSVLQRLKECAIDPIPLRGAALAAWLYGDVSQRMFADIDILVPVDRIADAAECLQGIGITPDVPRSGSELERLIRSDCEWHFTSPTGTLVELHWRLFQPRLQFQRIERAALQRSEPGSFLGHPVRMLSPEDTVLTLAVHHGGKHRWSELRHVCDFSELIRGELVDWRAVARRAQDTGMLRYIHTAVLVVQRVLGTAPPAALAASARGDRVAVKLSEALAGPFLEKSTAIHRVPQPLYFMRLRERLRDRLRYLPWLSSWFSKTVFVPTDKELRYLPLPRPLRPLLVPFRLVRLVVKYGLGAVRRTLRRTHGRSGVESQATREHTQDSATTQVRGGDHEP